MLKEDIDTLFSSMIASAEGISDLFFITGKPPQVECYGRLRAYPSNDEKFALTPQKIEEVALHIINGNARLLNEFGTLGACDCSYAIDNFARFRVNIFRQNGHHAIVMRKLQSQIPTLEQLNLQPIFKEIVKEKTGLIFITGATGSGKTTTLAALLNELNRTQEIHIVTLEDPIEFMHQHAKSTFSQRELGRDFFDFASGLRSALRQAPKVILVGEIRDRATMEIALTAAETGHVVYSTLHTINAGQSISRVLGMFSKDEETQVRQRLAETLRYIVSQRLVPRIGGGRVMVNEIMGSNLRTRETVLLGESEARNFQEIIEASYTFGWQSFDQALMESFEKELITEETAVMLATSKSRVRFGLDQIKKQKGADLEADGVKLRLSSDRDKPDDENGGVGNILRVAGR